MGWWAGRSGPVTARVQSAITGRVVGLIYSLRENKYSPLAQILKLDVKYHGLFFYSNVTRAKINFVVYSLLVPICLQTQFVIRDRAKILYIEFLRNFM